MKTPEELKKGLHICGSDELCEESNECPYYYEERCMSAMMADADAYILTLEADKAKLQAQNAEFVRKIEQLQREQAAVTRPAQQMIAKVSTNPLEICEQCHNFIFEDVQAYTRRLEQERDAAVACIPRSCGFCKWHELSFNGLTPDHDCKNPEKCLNISGINTGWEWRGVPEKEENDG